MRSKYTTSFSAVDDRFDFSRRGVFWCKRKLESLYLVMWSAIVILVTAIIWTVSIYADANFASIVFTLVFDALKLVSIIASPLLLIGGLRVIRSGILYDFTANNEKMLITCPKEDYRADIYYANVLNVEYKERHRFGKISGYNITVNCSDGVYTFEFVFPSKATIRHPDMTPFRMLEEQAGLLDRPEYVAGRRIDNANLM